MVLQATRARTSALYTCFVSLREVRSAQRERPEPLEPAYARHVKSRVLLAASLLQLCLVGCGAARAHKPTAPMDLDQRLAGHYPLAAAGQARDGTALVSFVVEADGGVTLLGVREQSRSAAPHTNLPEPFAEDSFGQLTALVTGG